MKAIKTRTEKARAAIFAIAAKALRESQCHQSDAEAAIRTAAEKKALEMRAMWRAGRDFAKAKESYPDDAAWRAGVKKHLRIRSAKKLAVIEDCIRLWETGWSETQAADFDSVDQAAAARREDVRPAREDVEARVDEAAQAAGEEPPKGEERAEKVEREEAAQAKARAKSEEAEKERDSLLDQCRAAILRWQSEGRTYGCYEDTLIRPDENRFTLRDLKNAVPKCPDRIAEKAVREVLDIDARMPSHQQMIRMQMEFWRGKHDRLRAQYDDLRAKYDDQQKQIQRLSDALLKQAQ